MANINSEDVENFLSKQRSASEISALTVVELRLVGSVMCTPVCPSMRKEESVQLIVVATCEPPFLQPDDPSDLQDSLPINSDMAAMGKELTAQGAATPVLIQPPSITVGAKLSATNDYHLLDLQVRQQEICIQQHQQETESLRLQVRLVELNTAFKLGQFCNMPCA